MSAARGRAWQLYLAVMAAATALYLFGPHALNAGPVFNLIGGSAVVALCVGARLHGTRCRRAWYLFALGQALFVVGDVLAYNYTRFFGGELPFPSIADIAYLAVYPSLVGGLLLLIHERNPARDRASLIDSLIITVGAATLSWAYLMAPYAHDATLSVPTKLISMAYPVMDLLVLGVAVRLAVGAGRRGAAFNLLASGIAALLVTDAIYGWLLLHGGYETGGVLDAGWALFYALFGAAALHPSMRRLSEPAPDPDLRLTRRRLGLLAAATLLAPAVLAVRVSLGDTTDVVVLTATAALLFALVVARMAGLVHRHEQAVRREAALRNAGEELVTATTRADVGAAAVHAAQSLTGSNWPARLYLVSAPNGDIRAVTAGDGDASALPALSLERLPADVVRVLAGRRAGTLESAAGGLPAAACLSPLFLREELRGLLVVLPEVALGRATEEGLATLAAQVALALESVARTDDLVRRRSEARMTSLVQHSSDVVCVVSADGELSYASPSTERVLGHAVDDVLGRPLGALVHPDDASLLTRFLAQVSRQAAADPSSTELRLRHADGGWRHVEALGTNLLADATVDGIVLNVRDVSERKAFEAQLAHQAFHDTLTELPNRALFRDRVEHALERRRPDGSRLSVLFLDLDDFKTINDSLGHAAGDELLREVGRRLAGSVRSMDTAARLGGDEFAILLDGADELHAADVAERAMGALAVPFELAGREVVVRASIGIAFADEDGRGTRAAEELLRNADVAMYMAKEQGKGGYQVFQPEMHAAALARLELKADLQRAVRAREFTLLYQPIVDLRTGEVAGVEALVRWHHPTRGVVPPSDFIPLAEDTGLIVPLGRLILDEACRHARVLQAASGRDDALTMSVNLSARQLQRPEIVGEVREALQASGIPPASLILELTESVMMEDVDLAVRRLHELRALGVKLAIDDFGTGYSSLNYLRHFPIDVLKIDRSFVRDAERSPEVAALTEAIIDLAAVLNLRAVAEGIEDVEQLKRLRERDCAYGQGFLFYRPLSAADALELVAAGGASSSSARAA